MMTKEIQKTVGAFTFSLFPVVTNLTIEKRKNRRKSNGLKNPQTKPSFSARISYLSSLIQNNI